MAGRNVGESDLTIYLMDLLKELGDLKGKLGECNGKFDTVITQMAIQDTRSTELDVRMRKVENRQHWYSGVAAAVGTLLGFGAHSVTH